MEYKLLKNKKAFELSSAFFALVVVSMIVVALGVWTNEWNTDYSSGLVYDLEGDFDKSSRLSGEAGGQKGNLTVRSSTQGTDFEGTSIKGIFGVLNNIYSPFRIVFGDNGMLDSLTDRFGIPNYIRQGFVTIMIMAITYTLIMLLFRLSKRRI